MNEHLQDLARRAGFIGTNFSNTVIGTDQETALANFAELVVRDVIKEMTQQLYWHKEDHSNNPNYYKAIEKTLRQFGVE